MIINSDSFPDETPVENKGEVFKNWHNRRYLRQCLFNLQEKYDCGGISKDEWKLILDNFDEYME